MTDSGMLVRIRSRMIFDLVGNGLTCSRKKSCIRSQNCIELDERVWEALSQFQIKSGKLKSPVISIFSYFSAT